ncbi:MAG: hypothetical protein GTO02_14205 [Candidatus Dadabacteria bacterium]|nr:hypothetical protein [Candidatus Dadabacteria bacterium]
MKKLANRFIIKLATKIDPVGQCYSYALNLIKKSGWDEDVMLVHGTVSAPFSDPPHSYNHAWIEKEGIVYDWQCMEFGHGGKYRSKGYPKAVFYELYDPQNMTRYDKEQALINAVRNGHFGPWD